ncbi:hypothetical protein QR98_0044500, partial [Sarcoptes scabiei]
YIVFRICFNKHRTKTSTFVSKGGTESDLIQLNFHSVMIAETRKQKYNVNNRNPWILVDWNLVKNSNVIIVVRRLIVIVP